MRRRVPGLAALFAVACATAPARPPAHAAQRPVLLAYAEVGDGRPVLLLHGAFGDLRTFRRALPTLAAAPEVMARTVVRFLDD